MGDLGGQTFDRRGIETGLRRHGIRRIGRIEIAFGQQLEGRHSLAAVRQDMRARKVRCVPRINI